MWTSYLDPDGYAKFWFEGRMEWAHRVAYRLWVGPIPEGLTVHHRCVRPSCMNPAHFGLLTHAENCRASGRAARTTCPKDHPFDAANTYWTKNGWRQCRTCNRENQRERARRKAA